MLNSLLQMHLKLHQNERFKKQQKEQVILIRNKVADKITSVLKTSPKNNSERNT